MSDILTDSKETDRGAGTISNPLEEMPGGKRVKGVSAEALGQARWLWSWDAAEYAADCHFCGALSKKVSSLGVVRFLREKAEPVRVLPQAFFMVFTNCSSALVDDTSGAIIRCHHVF